MFIYFFQTHSCTVWPIVKLSNFGCHNTQNSLANIPVGAGVGTPLGPGVGAAVGVGQYGFLQHLLAGSCTI